MHWRGFCRKKADFLLGTGLLILTAQATAGMPIGYRTVDIPAGCMWLEVPLNIVLDTDYLKIPVNFERGFKIGKYEVTNRQWDACHAAGACEKSSGTPVARKNHPVIHVDWHAAQTYATWLSKKTGRHYRLPTEQEFFYAASAGQGFRAGLRSPDFPHKVELALNPKKTLPVGSFGENAWGVADTLGNVWDWTLSCHTLSAERLLEPVDPQRLADPACCSTRIVGAGTRAHVPDFVSGAYNGGCAAQEPVYNFGFRLVLEEAR